MTRPAANASADLRRLTRMSRTQLYAHAQTYFRGGGGTQACVVAIAVGRARAVLKDYGRVRGWFARLIGPLLIAREARALEQLTGLAGVPALYRRVDGRALLMEYLPAQPWARADPPAQAFAAVSRLVAAMHARGIAHGDLRAPSNILVDAVGRPYLVDFVARLRRGARWNMPWNWVFRQFCCADRNALAKLKLRYAPELASDDERRRAVHRRRLDRLLRAFGAGVRSVTRMLVRAQ